MRRLPLLFALLFLFTRTSAQNLVPNGNFETYLSCPNGQNQSTLCSGWQPLASSSPDYFNTCGSGFAAAPANGFGFQNALSGQCYMGFINGAGNALIGSAQSEYLGRQIFTLQTGLTYDVSMSVSLAESSSYGCDGIGAYFFRSANFASVNGLPLLSATPQVSYGNFGVVMDTANWARLTGSFEPDSGYDYVAIGGYKAASTTGFVNAWGNNTYAYYYLDSVVITLKNHLNIGVKDTFFCLGDSVTLTAYADTNYITSANVFTFQLSDASGNFTSPTTLATATGKKSVSVTFLLPANLPIGNQYRVRVVASNPSTISDPDKFAITITGNSMLKPLASGNTPVCMGDTLSLSASNIAANATAYWSGPVGFFALAKTTKLKILSTSASGPYIITSLFHGCRARDTFNATALLAAFPLLTTKAATICEGDTLKLIANSATGASYSWSGPGSYASTLQSPNITSTTVALSGKYAVAATVGSCVTRDTFTATIKTTPVKPTVAVNTPVCVGDSIKLTGSTSTSGISYKWTGPASYTNTLQNPKINIAAATNAGYYVLAVTFGTCSSKDSANLVVLPSAYPVLTTKTVTVCEKDTIKLNSNTGPTGTTYGWSGPASFSASAQNTFVANPVTSQSGKYVVAETLGSCVTKDSVTVTVKPLPVKPVANSNTPICVGSPINFTGSTTTSGVSYSWTGPSYTSTQQNPTIAVAALVNSGNYILSATLNGCVARDTEFVQVNPLPAAPQGTANAVVCEKDTLKLSVTNKTTGITYSWAGPNSFVSDAPDTIITQLSSAATGSYIVTANLSNCLAKDTITVNVQPLPAKPFAGSNSPICSGATLNLTGSSATQAASFSWNGPGSYFSALQNSTIFTAGVSNSGQYILSADLNGCKQRDTVNVLVKQTPAAPTASSNSPVCIGGTLNFSAGTITNATYSWSGPSSFSSTAQNPVRNMVIPFYAGSYSVTATVNGCTSSAASTTVQVNQGPTVTIYPNPNDTICANASVTFAAIPTNGGTNPAFQWYKNSNQIVNANKQTCLVTTLANKDTFYVTLQATGGGCNTPIASNQMIMTVLPTTPGPTATISADPDTSVWAGLQLKFTATAAGCNGNITYQWYLDGKPVKDATTNPWLVNHLSDGSVISCVVKCHDRCPSPDTAESNKLNMHISTGINTVPGSKSAIRIYPNPNNGRFKIVSDQVVAQPFTIEILNTLGQLVFTGHYNSASKTVSEELDLSEVNNGVYLLRVKAGLQVWDQQLSIVH